jgi:methyl-accepting chemotaxis protein PixJ
MSSSPLHQPEDQPSINPDLGSSTPVNPNESTSFGNSQQTAKRMSKFGLRAKVTLAAIALGTIPLIMSESIGYHVANDAFTTQITQNKVTRAVGMADKVNRFMVERYGDIQVLAKLPVFTNAKVRDITSTSEKESILNTLVESYGVYDSIAVFDLKGNPIAQTKGKTLGNHSDREYFQKVLQTGQPVISSPEISKSSGKNVIHFAAPVKDSVTGQIIAIARSRMPVTYVEAAIKNFGTDGDEYHIADPTGKIFIASEEQQVGRNAQDDFAGLDKLLAARKPDSTVTIEKFDGAEQLVSYAPLAKLEGLPDLNWQSIIAIDTKTAFQPQSQLRLTLTLGALATAIAVGVIASILASLATKPIVQAALVAEQIGQGELDARADIKGNDELALLGNNLNDMAAQIQALLDEQEEAAKQQLAAQEEVAKQQMERALEQQAQKEFLQRRALELLMEVDPISRGDLTIRAKVTEDEIGTIADSYNATILSLRKIVGQVKEAAEQVTTTTTSSETTVQNLSKEANRQTEDVLVALNRLAEMAESIRMVSASALKAEAAVQEANATVSAGDEAMNRTVEGIVAIRKTVGETAKKVKRLGESSQKISRVVNLISNFAAQTNLLALNASIEAARAGEEGRGFAVVADEVRSLAQQSAEATADIEKLVAEIQMETNEVVTAMETGTEQVVMGTKLVTDTRESLNKISGVSAQINELVNAIAKAANTQTLASEIVSSTMAEVAESAVKTSDEATQVSASIQDLLVVAQSLQASVGQFKV